MTPELNELSRSLGWKFRRPNPGLDTYWIIRTYQSTMQAHALQPLFSDIPALEESFSADEYLWLVAEDDLGFAGFIVFIYETDQKLAKLFELRTLRNTSAPKLLESTHALLAGFFQNSSLFPGVDIEVAYTTSKALTLVQLESIVKLGFLPVGVFPGFMARDSSRINGISVLVRPGVLEMLRRAPHQLHPAIAPLFESVKSTFKLPDANEMHADIPESWLPELHLNHEHQNYEKTYALEVISAPAFVSHRFQTVRQYQALSSNFYPFHAANGLLLNPAQTIEVFVHLEENDKYATIVGERIEDDTHLETVYLMVVEALRDRGVTYVELINDASDAQAIDCAIRAGFIPCCYFPGLKRHGKSRRDYVVQAHSIEKITATLSTTSSHFRAFQSLFQESV